MKKYLLSTIFAFAALVATAQDINLTDSVIYFDNKPVAYYVKQMNESDPHYNVYIISLNMKLLVAAQIIKFEAPVRELKSFYYYDLILQDEGDTLAMYHEGQAFPLELATLLKDYKLLDGDKINKTTWRKFKRDYTGNADLKAKIKIYEDYLVENRFFDEQTFRDRTKPVTIINDKIIMQDGKKIGLIVRNVDVAGGGVNTSNTPVLTNDGKVAIQMGAQETAGAGRYNESLQFQLPTNRIVDASKVIIEPRVRNKKKATNPTLFDISLPLNKTAANEDLLWLTCQYVQNFLL